MMNTLRSSESEIKSITESIQSIIERSMMDQSLHNYHFVIKYRPDRDQSNQLPVN